MKPIEKITRFFEEAGADLQQLKHDYFVIGSAALVLVNCKIEKIADINILTSSSDANYLKQLWAGKMKLNHIYAYERIFRSNSGRFDFGFVDIEVMGNLEVSAGQTWVPLLVRQFMNVEVAGYQVKVPTTKEQHRIYKFFGRPKDVEKAKLLEAYL